MAKRKKAKAAKRARRVGKPIGIKKPGMNKEEVFANFIESMDTRQKELDRERNRMLKRLENKLSARLRRKEHELEKTREDSARRITDAEKKIGDLNNKLDEKSRIINELQKKLDGILKDLKV